VQIRDDDLRVDVYRSSGKGGQSVNTTDSAVRITHIPSGIVVAMQDERSQHQNREKALRVIRARLYEMERLRVQTERAAARNEQIGTGSRSERLRTYNYGQDRITDHRVGLSKTDVNRMMTGELLDEFIMSLAAHERETLLADLQSEL